MRRLFSLLALLLLVGAGAVGCGGTTGGMMMTDGGGDGSLALFAACTDSSECMSGLCTQVSYDQSPTPICTYKCDANDTNALCPMGCNPKGYCRQPM